MTSYVTSQTPLGELTALPQTPAGFKGLLLREGQGRGRLTCLPPRSDNPGYGSGEVIVIIVVNAYRKSTSTSVIGD